jgi:hypothetical protein
VREKKNESNIERHESNFVDEQRIVLSKWTKCTQNHLIPYLL